MPKNRRLRHQPSTPKLNLEQFAHHFTANPASPPVTPTTSPDLSRKSSLNLRHQPPSQDFLTSLEYDPSIKPVGNGHQFSYRPALAPHQLSPRSTSSSDAAAESSDEDEDSILNVENISNGSSIASIRNVPLARVVAILGSQSPMPKPIVLQDTDDEGDAEADTDEEDDEEDDNEEDVMDGEDTDEDDTMPRGGNEGYGNARRKHARTLPPTRVSTVLGVIIEELDPEDSEWDTASILHPYDIEAPRSRSASLHKELDCNLMQDLENLNCGAGTSYDCVITGTSSESDGEKVDDDDDDDFEMEMDAFYKRQAELKRIRRVSMSSSFGKRTHSELSDSDNEHAPLDVHELGSSARRLRKRLHRSSMLFNDPPEQIEELEEPDSSEDEKMVIKGFTLRVPYRSMEIMEVDSTDM